MSVGGRWIKMSIKHWRNVTKEGNQKYWEKKFLIFILLFQPMHNLYKYINVKIMHRLKQ